MEEGEGGRLASHLGHGNSPPPLAKMFPDEPVDECQELRDGTHPLFTERVSQLEKTQNEGLRQIKKLREERLRNVEQQYSAEKMQLRLEFETSKEALRERMIENVTDGRDRHELCDDLRVNTRKRVKLRNKSSSSTKMTYSRAKQTFTLSYKEIQSDIAQIERLTEAQGFTLTQKKSEEAAASKMEHELSMLDATSGQSKNYGRGRKRKVKSRYASKPKREVKDYQSFDKKGLNGRFRG